MGLARRAVHERMGGDIRVYPGDGVEQRWLTRSRDRKYNGILLHSLHHIITSEGIHTHHNIEYTDKEPLAPVVLVLVTCPSDGLINEHLVSFPVGEYGIPQTKDADVQVLSFTFGSLEDHLAEQLVEFGTPELFGNVVEYHRRRPRHFGH